jgi:hypothetical protein
LTVRTRKVAEQAAAEGKTPLEVMLDNMVHFQKVAVSAEAAIESLSADQAAMDGLNLEAQFKKLLAEVKKAAGFRQMAHECARDAAPYIHPRLQSIAHTGEDGGPVRITFSTVYEKQS